MPSRACATYIIIFRDPRLNLTAQIWLMVVVAFPNREIEQSSENARNWLFRRVFVTQFLSVDLQASEAENDLHFLELAFHPSVVTVSCHHRMSSHRVFKHHFIKLDISVCCCGMDIVLVLVAAVVEPDCNLVSLQESIMSQERYHRRRHAFCNMIQPNKNEVRD